MRMEMYAYLEQINGEWLDDFVYMSKEPLKALGFEIRAFDGDDMENTLTCYPLDIRYDVIIGSVEATTAFFKECDIDVPEYLGYPEELTGYLWRYVAKMTIGELDKYKFPYFIKPATGVKLFTGELISKQSQLTLLTDYYDVEDSTEIYFSKPVDFISEYRCFVHEGELKGVQYYLGDYKIYPDMRVVDRMIADYKSANCAYTLDVGLTPAGQTILVEVNDMWAIGSYGMNAKTYALMCVRRMREIGRQAQGETESLWKRLKERDL